MSHAPAATPCSFDVVYLPDSGAPLADGVLACVHFGATGGDDDPRRIRVPLQQFGAPAQMELWRSRKPVQHGRAEGFSYAHNGEVLMAQLWLDEAALADLGPAVARAYADIERLLHRLGYPFWLRTWNYLAHLNRGEGDQERYRQFVDGRYRALAKPAFEAQLPAATAIGTHTGGLLIYLLAARTPGQQTENPRQVSAFEYPREYGPTSPSFSRATRKRWSDVTQLFVSGTASIVGHATVNAGDPLAQLDETARNLGALLESSAMQAGTPVALKLYARNRDDFAATRARARELFGKDAPLICLHGDVCRRDLLVEVEALYAAPTPA
jgi:chorismate lyase / 3-hydroxybenzoate synthase